MTVEIIAHIRRSTVVTDFEHIYAVFFDIQTVKPFTVREITGNFILHSIAWPGLLSETEKVGYRYFQTESLRRP